MYTILLIENNTNQRLLYKQELQYEGYQVMAARDGRSAINMLIRHWPDIIVTDLVLPNFDYFETMERILNGHKKIPIIINTALILNKVNFIPYPADAYLTKSSDMKELKNKIRELLSEQREKLITL